MKHLAMAVAVMSTFSLAAQAQNVKQHGVGAFKAADFVADPGGEVPPGPGPGPSDSTPPESCGLWPDNAGVVVTLSVVVPADSSGVGAIGAYVSTSPIDDSNVEDSDGFGDNGGMISNPGAAGTVRTFSMALSEGTTYYLAARAVDVYGNMGSTSSTVITIPVAGQGSGAQVTTGGEGDGGNGGFCSAGGSMGLGLMALAIPMLAALLRK